MTIPPTLWASLLFVCLAFALSVPRSPEQRAQAKAQRWAKRQCEER